MSDTMTIAECPAPLLPRVGNLTSVPDHWSLVLQGTRPQQGAAVMLLFLLDPGLPDHPARVVLTRRSTKVRSHKGQISLPGGRWHSLDEPPKATALREVEEEVGIEPQNIHLLGALKTFRALDSSCVLPLVGWCRMAENSLVPHGDEVADILLVDWTKFARSESRNFSFNLFGVNRSSHLFQIDGHRVWGLTAAVLFEADLCGV